MTDYLETARKALALSKKGKTNVEIKLALGLAYAKDAARAVDIGQRQARIDEAALTKAELDVIKMLAASERRRNANGDNSAFSGKWLGGAGWGVGQALRLIRKRLGYFRQKEKDAADSFTSFDLRYNGITGLGLIDHWHGGGVKLTRAGWALVHALEAQGGGQ